MIRTATPYRAFVSSTFEDLKDHRAYVIQALQSAGIDVDPMEKWTANSKSPHEFCPERMARCNLCVLLVALRRGHIPKGEQRSITQLEYDEARKRGIDILPFLLDDSPETVATWNPAYDERVRDPEVDVWRRSLKERHGIEIYRAAPETIRIDSAIARWVVETESERARRFRRRVTRILVCVALLVLAFLGYAAYAYRSPEHRSRYLSRFLAYHDGNIFNNSSDGRYEIARVLDSYSTLSKETRLSDEIRATSHSFDMLVNNAQYIRHAQKQNVLDIIQRGASVRIILWDYSDANRVHYDAFCRSIRQEPTETREGARNVHNEFVEWKALIDGDKAKFPGSFEFRWNTKPLFYTMWIRDWGQPNAMGHLSVHLYRGQEYFPSLRFSMRDGARTLENLHTEFEHAWAEAAHELPVQQE